MKRKDIRIKQIEKISFFKKLYNDVLNKNIEIIFKNSDIRELQNKGFKYCPRCHVMIRIKETFCRKCNNRLRFKPKRYAIITNPPSTEPIFKIPTLFKDFLKVNGYE